MNLKGKFGLGFYLCVRRNSTLRGHQDPWFATTPNNAKAEVNTLMISAVHTSVPVDPPDIKPKTINKMLCCCQSKLRNLPLFLDLYWSGLIRKQKTGKRELVELWTIASQQCYCVFCWWHFRQYKQREGEVQINHAYLFFKWSCIGCNLYWNPLFDLPF